MSEANQPSSKRSGRSQVIFWGLIAAAVVVLIVFRHVAGPRLDDQGLSHPASGSPLPDLQLVSLTGASTDTNLNSLKGNVALINFWGTWCGPCRYELPHIAQLRTDFAARSDFRLLAVSCGAGEQESVEALRTTTQRFLAQQKIDLPTYADPSGATRSAVGMVLGELGLTAYPTTVLLDRQGIVRGVWVGYMPGVEMDMRKAIEEVLKGKGMKRDK